MPGLLEPITIRGQSRQIVKDRILQNALQGIRPSGRPGPDFLLRLSHKTPSGGRQVAEHVGVGGQVKELIGRIAVKKIVPGPAVEIIPVVPGEPKPPLG